MPNNVNLIIKLGHFGHQNEIPQRLESKHKQQISQAENDSRLQVTKISSKRANDLPTSDLCCKRRFSSYIRISGLV